MASAFTYSNKNILLSPPIDIYWLGFKSNTAKLYQFGWEFVVENNDFGHSFSIALKHERDEMYGISEDIDYRMLMVYSRRHDARDFVIPPIGIKIGSKIIINERKFQPVSMEPKPSTEEEVLKYAMPYSIEYFFNQKNVLPKGKKMYQSDTDKMKRKLDILVEKGTNNENTRPYNRY